MTFDREHFTGHPLHLAIIDNDIDSLKSLLIDCNTPCKQRSPLSLAVELNRAAAAQCLLAAGANLFTKVEGMSAVEYVATRGGAEMMRALIDGSRAKGVNIVEIDNLCHAAASNANEEILAMLIDAGAAFELADRARPDASAHCCEQRKRQCDESVD
jgi:ankyrin repeat protein